MKNRAVFIIIVITFGLFTNTYYVSADTENVWNVEKGAVFEWDAFDNYYNLADINTRVNESDLLFYEKKTQGITIGYQNVKSWNDETPLRLSIGVTDLNVKNIEVNITYYTLSGMVNIDRNYTDYGGEIINTIVPSRLDVLLPRVFGNPIYREPYTLSPINKNCDVTFSGAVFHRLGIVNETEYYFVLDSLRHAFVGNVSVFFHYKNESDTEKFSYTFHYNSNNKMVDEKNLREYNSNGFSLEILEIRNTTTVESYGSDLITLIENSFDIKTRVETTETMTTLSYGDITSSIISLITMIVRMLSVSFEPASRLNYSNVRAVLPFGFSSLSGVDILHGDIDRSLGVLMNASLFMNVIMLFLLNKAPLSFDMNAFLNEIFTADICLASFYNLLVLFSLFSYPILPNTVNLDRIENIINGIAGFDKTDLSRTSSNNVNLYYILSNGFKYRRLGDIKTISIDSDALPLLLDSLLGPTSIGIKMTWKENVLHSLKIDVNYIEIGYGHVLGVNLKESEIRNNSGIQLTDLVSYIVILLGTGGIAVIIKKKRGSSNIVPFKSIVSNVQKNEQCFNGFCID